MPGKRPFELSQKELETRIEEMVSATFADISSEFLLMPTGTGLVRYPDFQAAYETTTLDRLIACTRIREFVSR